MDRVTPTIGKSKLKAGDNENKNPNEAERVHHLWTMAQGVRPFSTWSREMREIAARVDWTSYNVDR